MSTPARLSGGRLRALRDTMQEASAAHGWFCGVVAALAAGALLMGWVEMAAWMMLFNMLLNGYPARLQRYNRVRLLPLLRR